MTYQPVFLDLRGRAVVVVGQGPFALAKTRELLEAGARVRVVSAAPDGDLDALAASGRIEILRRPYRPGDLGGAWLAILATGDSALNREIGREAEAARIWVNAVDDVPNCSFIAGSTHRQGDVVVAVSTAGACPALAVRLRHRIGRWIGPEYAAFARMAARLRAHVARRIPEFDRRKRFWYALVDSEALDLIRRGKQREAGRLARRLLDAAVQGGAARAGRVVLVGAGPGDPSLITERGLGWLRAADVVVHDRLVSPALLAEATGARLLDVGKIPDRPSIGQDEINLILIEEARAGRLVVRLKGGDPFVFGRGAEEIDALDQAGISHEVVPGVTSAIAAPGAAGIPVTRRGTAAAFAVVSGRRADEGVATDWAALARIPTLIVLMGRARLGSIVDRLGQAGLAPDTPAAMIADATLPTERVARGTLATIEEEASTAGIGAPATLVIGEVARTPEPTPSFAAA